jgi:hypothetical protein
VQNLLSLDEAAAGAVDAPVITKNGLDHLNRGRDILAEGRYDEY